MPDLLSVRANNDFATSNKNTQKFSQFVENDMFFNRFNLSFEYTKNDDPVPKDVFGKLSAHSFNADETKQSNESNKEYLKLLSEMVSLRIAIRTLNQELRKVKAKYFKDKYFKDNHKSRPLNFERSKRCRYPVHIRFTRKTRKNCWPKDSITQSTQDLGVIPKSKPCVSVLFSDIVGFTKISSTLSAAKVSDLLRRLYARFDALAAQHGVTNVDIIGDAYMAATNLHDDQHSDHAARLARFAIDAVRAAQDTPIDADSPDSPSVQIRVGVHCGPVSACVLGAHGGKLTLVGDTVNVASRMESCSIPGHVQCSEAAAALIARQAPDVELEPRAGGVHVKGKGQMRTCWVGSAASSENSCQQPHRSLMCRPASADGFGPKECGLVVSRTPAVGLTLRRPAGCR